MLELGIGARLTRGRCSGSIHGTDVVLYNLCLQIKSDSIDVMLSTVK
jgi:hypothetical protein